MSLQQELELSSESSSSSSWSSTNTSIASPPSGPHLVNESSLHPYRCLRSFRQEGADHQHHGLEHFSVYSLALHQELLAGGLASNQISIWRSSTATQLCTLKAPAHAGAVKALLMSGDKLFSAHQDHKIRVWRVSELQHCLIATLPTLRNRLIDSPFASHQDAVSCLALTDKLLYSASWDKTVKVWRLSNFKCLESFVAHSQAINAVVVNQQLGLLYTGSADSTVKIWQRTKDSSSTRKKKKAHRLVAHLHQPDHLSQLSAINALALSSDGARLFAGRSDSSISVWGPMNMIMKDSSLVKHSRISGHQQAVLCLATLDDLLCSGSADRTIRLWKLAGDDLQLDYDLSYNCVSIISGSNGPVKSLALKVDRLGFCNVYSGSLDCEIKLWRINHSRGPSLEENWRNGDRISEHFYFPSECNEVDKGDGAPWKVRAIRCALEEEVAHFLLAFQALEC